MNKQEVYFLTENHRYLSEKGPYRSVSGIMKYVEKPFNLKNNLLRSAIKEVKPEVYIQAKKVHDWDDDVIFDWMRQECVNLGITEEITEAAKKLKKTWESNSESGTKLHDSLEEYDIKKGYCEYKGIKYKVIPRFEVDGYANSSETITRAIKDYRENIFLPEGLVHTMPDKRGYDPMIAGQIDKLHLIYLGAGSWSAIIGDYKTDKSLNWKGIYSRSKNKETGKTKGYSHMFPPFNHYTSSKLNYYTIKMNYYATFLYLKYGIKTVSMYITNFPRENKKNINYPIPNHLLPAH